MLDSLKACSWHFGWLLGWLVGCLAGWLACPPKPSKNLPKPSLQGHEAVVEEAVEPSPGPPEPPPGPSEPSK